MFDNQDMWKPFVAVLALLLVVRRARSWTTRWQLHNQIEDYYKGKYALTKEDEKRGFKRINKSGYKGIHDAQMIMRQTQFKEMPLLYHKALEFALFRTYAIPSISKILLRTGNLAEGDKSTRRYMDTVLLIVSISW
jgi:hypothetical protein